MVTAGEIADGRGIAAALAPGTQGVCMGTRFLATTEMSVAPAWKRRIVEASPSDAVKIPNADLVMPPFTLPQIGEPFAPRSLPTPLTDRLRDDPDSVVPEEVGLRFVSAVCAGGRPSPASRRGSSTTSSPGDSSSRAWSPRRRRRSAAHPPR
jgi:enoyl-[acyl-carrier protein] reductase II